MRLFGADRISKGARLLALNESKPTEPGLRVLLVDDDAGIRSGGTCLESDGQYVETADDGVQALKKLQGQNWDLVLTDRIMPKLNGDGLAKVIKQDRSD